MLLRLERHRLGPRVHVLGRRVHEWHFGLAVIALAIGGRLGGLWREELATGAIAALGAYLVVKDWHDLVPSHRDTASWTLGIHRRLHALRERRRGEWVPPVVAGLVGLAGVANLVSALRPTFGWHGHILLDTRGIGSVPLFHALALPASVVLLSTALYLAKRRRRAFQVALVLLVALGVFDLLKGIDLEEALLSWAVAAVLWWCREAFVVRHAPLSLRAAVWRIPLLGAAVAGLASLVAAVRSPARASAHDIARESLALMSWTQGPVVFHDEARFVPMGIGLLTLGSALVAAWAIFRPLAAPRALPDAEVRRAAVRLVREYGTDTLACFKLRRDKRYLFSPDGRALIGYRVESGVLLVSGDPVGADDAIPEAVRATAAFAESRGLRLAVLGASELLLPVWRDAGLRSLYMGDEAIVETAAFSLEGRAIRKVRQSLSRLEKAGYTASVAELRSLPADGIHELELISEEWLHGQPERGFAMAMDALDPAGQPDSVVVVARDGDGVARGFLHLVPTYGRPAMSLSLMRRDRSTPNGLTEYLVIQAIALLKERGVEEISLNFAAFARWLHSPHNRVEKTLGRIVSAADRWFQIESLYRFNAKFFPRWEPRYFLYEGALGLPRAGLAALWVEGQLPKPGGGTGDGPGPGHDDRSGTPSVPSTA